MIKPNELKLDLPMEVGLGAVSTTGLVWEILNASKEGDDEKVKALVELEPGLIYAQYNYTPPIHFAVREGHSKLVYYLLENGAHDPTYRTYPFLDGLSVVARDRGFHHIAEELDRYSTAPAKHKFKGDNGTIRFKRTELDNEFEKAVDRNNCKRVGEILKDNPELAEDETFFWGEGILMMPAKKNQREMIDLLMEYGAKVPAILKWTQNYYFEHPEGSKYMMLKGMNPNTMSWHHVTILHDMAMHGHLAKAELLLRYGADIDPIEEEYQSTPLGLAARWGQVEMVRFLLKHGADVNKAGAEWAKPLSWAKMKNYPDIEKELREAGAL